MKFALYSDLHLEFSRSANWVPPELDVDVVLLAGDIHTGSSGLDWAGKTFASWKSRPEVLYLPGNHEFYNANYDALIEVFRTPRPGVVALDQSVLSWTPVTGPSVRLLGCTLWSDFALHGSSKISFHKEQARLQMNDYLAWLDLELSKPWDGRTVIVTHNAPHPDCVEERYRGSAISPAFVSDLRWLMRKHRIDLWCFGHTHGNCDFKAKEGCRIVSNQMGYPGEGVLGFRPELVIEI
jgi:predicted phosphodiesterase